MKQKTEEKILEILGKEDKGMSITGISKELKIERHTIANYLNQLKLKGFVAYKEIGMAKLWYLTDSPFLSLFKDQNSISDVFKSVLDNTNQNVSIIDKNMNVIWTNKNLNLKPENNSKCHELYGRGDEICESCPVEKTFKTGETQISKETIINEGKNNTFNLKTIPIKDDNKKIVAVVELMEAD